jgi:hypothetical protein
MKTATKKPVTVTEKTWEKLHAAYVAPPDYASGFDRPTLQKLATRFRIPRGDVEVRALREEWEAERDAVEARAFFDSTAPGVKTELAYCLHRAAEMTAVLGSDLGAIGGESLLDSLISDARVVWRRRMSSILIWEAMQATERYRKRTQPAASVA